MTGEAPVPKAREMSLSPGGVRSLGRVGFGVGRGVAFDISHQAIALNLGEDDGRPLAAGAVAEPGAKVA